MNPRHALNGTLYGLQQVHGEQSSFSHALLAGLEALVQEGQGAWTGGRNTHVFEGGKWYNCSNRITQNDAGATNTRAVSSHRKGELSMASSDITTFDSTTEEWRDVPGYEGRYQASSLGRILSFAKQAPLILKPKTSRDHYFRVILKVQGVQKTFLVHRLVLLTFSTPPSSRHQVNHINGDKSDNRLVNLEWVTPRENIKHSIEILGNYNIAGRGEAHGGVKLTNEQVYEIRRLFNEGTSKTEISRRFGVARTTIYRIVYRINWTHLE